MQQLAWTGILKPKKRYSKLRPFMAKAANQEDVNLQKKETWNCISEAIDYFHSKEHRPYTPRLGLTAPLKPHSMPITSHRLP